MKPYLDLLLLNTSAALLEMPENFENFNKLLPKKYLKEAVQAVTHLKKCKPKNRIRCIILYCIVFKGRSTKASGVTTFVQILIESNLKVDFSEHLTF